MRRKRAAYSLVELILIVLFVAVLASIAVPRLKFTALHRKQADTVARKIVTDLRRTRSLAVSDAANNTNGFALRMSGSAPYTGYEIVNYNTMAVVDSHAIDRAITVNCTDGNTFRFGPLGNLITGGGTGVTVSADGKVFTISIVSATGTIKCVGN